MEALQKGEITQRLVITVNCEQGFSLLEVLVSISLLAVSGLAISTSAMHSIRTLKFVEINHVANSLAISKMEEIASLDTLDILPALSETETEVSWPGSDITYTRSAVISINADDSRTVSVDVQCNNPAYATSVNFVNTFALWE